MSIEFQCNNCHRLLSVPDGTDGKACICPGCHTRLTIPMPETAPEVEVLSETHCPNCQHTLIYEPQLEGTRGLCKACNHIFTITQTPIAAGAGPHLSDSFPFECPQCHKLFEGKRGFEGRKGKCDQCHAVFIIEPITPKPVDVKPRVPSAPTLPARTRETSHDLKATPSRPNQNTTSTPVESAARSTPRANPPSQPTLPSKPIRSDPTVRPNTPQHKSNSSPSATNQPQWKPAPEVFEAIEEVAPDAVWQDISAALPPRNVREDAMDWEVPTNPYHPNASGTSSVSRNRYPGLFQKAFELGTRDLLKGTLMMFLVNLVLSLCMIPIALIFGGFLALFGESLSIRTWPPYAMILFFALMIIPMFAIMIYFLPAFWNIAHRYVYGKEVTFTIAIERKDLAGRFLPWILIQGILTVAALFIEGMIFTLLMFGAAAVKSPAILIVVLFLHGVAAGLVTLVASSPLLLAPYAWLDGAGFMDSLRESVRLTTRHPFVFLGLSVTAYLLGVLITLVTCGIGNIFMMSLILMLHAAYYKLTKAHYRNRN
jgi:hypothetical protein